MRISDWSSDVCSSDLACLIAALVGLLLAVAAHAANPADWWVDISHNRVASVKTMLARGADPNEISPKGQPDIMQAIRDGAWDVYDLQADNKKADQKSVQTGKSE